METELVHLNLTKVCRVCLLESESMFSIYSELFEENSNESIPKIHEILNQISSIKVEPEDNLPKLICSKCVNKAHSSYKFLEQCNKSHSFLNTYIAQLNKSNSKEITENSVRNVLCDQAKQVDKEIKTKNEEIGINDELLQVNHNITHIKYKSNDKKIILEDNVKDIECINKYNNFPHYNPKIQYIDDIKSTNISTSVTKNFSFEDDFNSVSDILSLTGEDVLSTDDILKSLDLISNVGNQDDLDLDEAEDCDDLKSCILLGDETVDQLINDNLQVDNLDSMTPKIKSFNFNTIDKGLKGTADKTTHKCLIEKPTYIKHSNEHISLKCPNNKSIQFENHNKKLTYHLKSSCKQPPPLKSLKEATDVDHTDTVRSVPFHCLTSKHKLEFFSLKPSSEGIKLGLTASKTPLIAKVQNPSNECNIGSNYLKIKYSECIASKSSDDKVKFASELLKCSDILPVTTTFSKKSNNVLVPSKNLHNVQKSEPGFVQNPLNEPEIELLLLQNPKNDPEASSSLIKLMNTSTVEAVFGNENKMSSSPISYTKSISLNKTNQSKCQVVLFSKPNIVNSREEKSIPEFEDKSFLLLNSKNSKAKAILLDAHTNDKHSAEPISLNKLNKESVLLQEPVDIKDELNSVESQTNKTDEQLTFKIPNTETKSVTIPFRYSSIMKNRLKEEWSEQINCVKDFSDKIKVEMLPIKNPNKEYHTNLLKSSLVSESEIRSVPFKHASNELKEESISFKCPTLEHITFKHPRIANMKSKYFNSRNNLIKKTTDKLVQHIQLNDIKPIQYLEPFSRIRTFSIKPREPPNMDYYKKEKEDNIVDYECNICPKKFRFAHNLRIHIKNHGLDKPFICSECKKDFKVYGSLVHHSRSHSGEQPYECQVCGKRYKQSGTLTAHMRVHTGQKPFACKVCGKGFRQAPDLTYHMRTHTKEKPYMCTICGKTMSMQCHLVQHMRSHTGEKPFKCLDCDKAFPSSTRLKRHTIIHTTLKPFKCKICNKAFNRNSSLQVHMKVHSGFRSHICPYCKRGFYWAHSLRTHMTSHFKENENIKTAALTSGISHVNNEKSDSSTIKNEPRIRQ